MSSRSGASQTLHPKQDAVNKFLIVPKDFRKDEARVNNTLGFTPVSSILD